MKNKSMVIYTANNFNITIQMTENAIGLCQSKEDMFLNAHNLKRFLEFL